ncbi:MAG: hypothetical protein C4523_20180 [Myxococcales bacterium]|nr:MAG: hypothetical protein C4523_20180 [Myxococcales bacterium]
MIAAFAAGATLLSFNGYGQEPAQPDAQTAQPGIPGGGAPDAKPEPIKKEKTWSDYITPDLKGFVYYKLDATDGKDLANEFGVGRAYVGAKIKPADHFLLRLTLDAKARVTTAKGKSGTETVEVKDDEGNVIGTAEVPTTEVENTEGAYDVYLKYAYIEAYDVGVKGLTFRLGQAGFLGINEVEDYWTYRLQGPILLDAEKYMSSADLGLSIGYNSPDGLVKLHATVVNGEGYGRSETGKSKDGQLALFFRPGAKQSGFLHSLVIGAHATYGKYDLDKGADRRLRAGGLLGMADAKYCLFTEAYYVQDPTSERVKEEKKIIGVDSPLTQRTDELTSGLLAAVYGWLDFGLFASAVDGLRLVGRYDYVDPNLDFSSDQRQRFVAGVGYVFNKYVQILADGQFTVYGGKAGYDQDKAAYLQPTTEKLALLQMEAKY